MQDPEMEKMLIEYMGKGFLDNIIALFKQEPSLSRFIPGMLGSESLHVRIGTVALVEELIKERRAELAIAVPGLIELLKHKNPTIRGDAASVLGAIKDLSSRPALETCLEDAHPAVREAARDALREIGEVH